MKKLFRIFFYLLGAVILAFGITLNTKTGLGVSPIVSVPYTVSQLWGLDFGNLTFIFYSLLVVIQFAVRGRDVHWLDLLQILLSLVFTRVLNLFGDVLPMMDGSIAERMIALLGAIAGTGVGAAMMLNSRFIANPGDGIVQAISDVSGKSKSLVKNLIDLTCAAIAVALGLIFGKKLIGVGLGTVITVLGVGRAMWLYDKLFKAKTDKLSGMK